MLVEFKSSGADVRLTDGRRTFGLARSNTKRGIEGYIRDVADGIEAVGWELK